MLSASILEKISILLAEIKCMIILHFKRASFMNVAGKFGNQMN